MVINHWTCWEHGFTAPWLTRWSLVVTQIVLLSNHYLSVYCFFLMTCDLMISGFTKLVTFGYVDSLAKSLVMIHHYQSLLSLINASCWWFTIVNRLLVATIGCHPRPALTTRVVMKRPPYNIIRSTITRIIDGWVVIDGIINVVIDGWCGWLLMWSLMVGCDLPFCSWLLHDSALVITSLMGYLMAN